MIRKLAKNHRILCTSRRYKEATTLAKVRKLPVRVVGRHGGGDKLGKLKASIDRIGPLIKIVSSFKPDLVVSFTSPDAARVAFGLGINHIGFTDAPHSNAALRLSVPLVQKLLVPWIIPKSAFTKFGINQKDIMQYRAIDAASIIKRTTTKVKLPFDASKKTILIRPKEDQASYIDSRNTTDPIIANILKKYKNENIIVLARYASQKRKLEKKFGKNIKVINMTYDGKVLLENCDVFVGSGGTMTSEAALMGIPTISYDAVPNLYEQYIIRKGLAIRIRDPKKIIQGIEKAIASKDTIKKRARKEMLAMKDPYDKLLQAMKLLK